MNESLEIIEWIAFSIGTVGNIIWATNSKYSKWASLLWLISSFFWIYFANGNKHYGLLLSNIVSTAIYIYGTKKWLSKKKSYCKEEKISL